MGESIMEATILNWVKQPGDAVETDETILEIATDKVDSEIPSPVTGTISKLMFGVNDVVPIGAVIALIETSASNGDAVIEQSPAIASDAVAVPVEEVKEVVEEKTQGDRFYSPLVKNIASKENIPLSELDQVPGSGQQGRLTKQDLLNYIEERKTGAFKTTNAEAVAPKRQTEETPVATQASAPVQVPSKPASSIDGDVEIIEMDRMRKLIADHMVMSKQTSPHVTSFVEVDVTPIVQWREKVKKEFVAKYGQNITYTPIFIEAVAKAIRDFPMINSSVDGNNIVRKKNINIGMAAAMPSGNLIVPVIKNADNMNLLGITKAVNDLATRARANQLKADEIQGGTFTITNVGGFGNVMGTPIINQPQVAILAVGVIKKKPVVLELPEGDVIGIRHMMFMSLSYDHRIVDGSLGGSFLRRVGDYLETFDSGLSI